LVKNTFIYVIVLVLVAIAVWFFVNKAKTASKVSDTDSLLNSQGVTATPIASVTKSEGEWLKLESGLEIQDVIVGSGQEAKDGDIVVAHYLGTLVNGKKFDSSYDRGQPFSFILGGGMVIKGWDLGVLGMKVGGKRKLVIPPDLGYGKRGAGGGAIPADATLFFEIELVGIQKQDQSQ